MLILLTNDDGIHSAGIRALRDVLSPVHDVWVVAPETEKSGSSHGITLKSHLRCCSRDEKAYSITGTPVDCVMSGILKVLPTPPDIVVSGINHGPNIGTDLLYSGTAAAARQASLLGIPGFALSLANHTRPEDFEPGAAFFLQHLDELLQYWSDEVFLNINFPTQFPGEDLWRWTHPARRKYHDRMADFTAPNKDRYFFLHGEPMDHDADEGSDLHAVQEGVVSVSPILVYPSVPGGSIPDGRYRKP